MFVKKYPSQEYLREAFEYRDGKLYWSHNRPLSHFKNEGRRKSYLSNDAGNEAGRKTAANRRSTVLIKGVHYVRSRLVWIWHNGEIKNFIDHINRDPSDDRIENLRDCTHSQNLMNASLDKRNKSGVRGVYKSSVANRWIAAIRVRGKDIYLGCFKTIEEAAKARANASRKYFGEFSNECN